MQQTVTLKENDNFTCLCTAATAHFSSTATLVKDGEKKRFLRKVAKNVSGTYICRTQLHTLIGEKSVVIMVQCKCFYS